MEKISEEQVMLMLNMNKNKTSIQVSKECTVGDLYKRTRQYLGNTGKGVGMMLYFGGEELDEASLETITSQGIGYGNSLEIVLLANPGIKCLTPLPGYIEVTDEPCCILEEADPIVKQAKMPCGCVIGVEAMKQHCNTTVDDSRFLLTCPNCGSSMKYFLVRHVLSVAMTDDELESFNQKVNANLMNSSIKIQRCPGCSIYLQRDSSKTFINPNWVQCPACSAKNGRNFEFCWVCLKPWKGNGVSCGNENCNGKDPRIQIIETCETKVIGYICDVPSIRCCAKCGNMIEHKGKCKQMNCSKCHYEFCFVCLKPRASGEKGAFWQCGEVDSKCNVAPRQTKIFDIEIENVVETSRPTIQKSLHAKNTDKEWWPDSLWDLTERYQNLERQPTPRILRPTTMTRVTETSSRSSRKKAPVKKCAIC